MNFNFPDEDENIKDEMEQTPTVVETGTEAPADLVASDVPAVKDKAR